MNDETKYGRFCVQDGTQYTIFIVLDALNAFDPDRTTPPSATATAGIFATYPEPHLTTTGGLFDQVID